MSPVSISCSLFHNRAFFTCQNGVAKETKTIKIYYNRIRLLKPVPFEKIPAYSKGNSCYSFIFHIPGGAVVFLVEKEKSGPKKIITGPYGLPERRQPQLFF